MIKCFIYRLENLLVEYPPEEVEAKRWSKIAEALGNRTPIQVTKVLVYTSHLLHIILKLRETSGSEMSLS